jgi:hypothetical protein
MPAQTREAALEEWVVVDELRQAVWVPVGETEGGDNTGGMLSTGGLQPAQWLQRMLGLAPIEAIVAVP